MRGPTGSRQVYRPCVADDGTEWCFSVPSEFDEKVFCPGHRNDSEVPCPCDAGEGVEGNEARRTCFAFPYYCRAHQRQWIDHLSARGLLSSSEADEIRIAREREESGWPFDSMDERARTIAECSLRERWGSISDESLEKERARGIALLLESGAILLPPSGHSTLVSRKVATKRLFPLGVSPKALDNRIARAGPEDPLALLRAPSAKVHGKFREEILKEVEERLLGEKSSGVFAKKARPESEDDPEIWIAIAMESASGKRKTLSRTTTGV